MDSRFKNIVLFLISFCVIFLFVLLITSDNKRKSSIVVKHSKYNYTIYEVDNEVTLQNNSVWYVLKENTTRDRDVYLISKDKVNNEAVADVDHFVKEKYLDNGNVEKVDNEVTKYVNEMSNIFDMVHKKVLSISDNKKKSDYSKQLLTTILDYTEKSKLFYKNGVDIRYHNSIIDRVSLLEHDIDIVLAEEKEKRSREEETNRMLNAVDEVINYRASGK